MWGKSFCVYGTHLIFFRGFHCYIDFSGCHLQDTSLENLGPASCSKAPGFPLRGLLELWA